MQNLYSCSCSAGMEYVYQSSGDNENPLQDPIGSFYCQNNADLCVKDIFGRQWRPASADNLITIIPSTKCIDEGRHCAVFLFLIASRPSTTADMTSASESLRYLDMVEGGRFLPFSRHVYIPIQGFSCNSCAESYCRAQ
ncbi:hypothetical protein Q1695_006114 [Nippostrongylus brasiliensis]|nr:hypothetical protein Q1695_006114 [Nippostrongylus brasiliensis]